MTPAAEVGSPAGSHREVAAAVAAGAADAGLVARAAAAACSTGFVPLEREPFELVMRVDALGRAGATALRARLADPALVAHIRGLGGYDLSRSGRERWAA